MKRAFTLAEVLITLGIIGVVAALTIPSLIANYRKQVLLTQIKRTYTVLNNALERAKADNGTDVNQWYIPDGTNRIKSMYFAENYLLPYLNVLQYCGDDRNKDGCNEKIYWLSGGADVFSPLTNEDGTNIILNDGTNLYINVGEQYAGEGEGTNRVRVIFDIDGVNKGKNTYGYDVFGVELGGIDGPNKGNNADKNKFLPYQYSATQSCSYYTGTQPHACNKKAQYGGGSTCLAYIVCNGWTFGENYPW